MKNKNDGFEIKCLKCGSKDFKSELISKCGYDSDGHQYFYTSGFKIVCKECENEQCLK